MTPGRGEPGKKRATVRRVVGGQAAPIQKLMPLLAGLRQGDVISLGAVSLVGRGPSAATELASEEVAEGQLWAVTVESEVGWYVIMSGSCDIERVPAIEPCLAISPVDPVTAERYHQLRRGSYSPREFPLPPAKIAQVCEADGDAFFPVVNGRYITSLDKTALLHADVQTLRPLTGPQQKRFGEWVANRFGRAAHPGEIEDNVLDRLGKVVRRLSKEFNDKVPADRTPAVRLVGASTEWLLAPGDRGVDVHVLVSDATCRTAGLHIAKAGEIDGAAIEAARKKLVGLFRGAIRPLDGYAVKVEVQTLNGMSAADYQVLEPWSWAENGDPLADD